MRDDYHKIAYLAWSPFIDTDYYLLMMSVFALLSETFIFPFMSIKLHIRIMFILVLSFLVSKSWKFSMTPTLPSDFIPKIHYIEGKFATNRFS